MFALPQSFPCGFGLFAAVLGVFVLTAKALEFRQRFIAHVTLLFMLPVRIFFHRLRLLQCLLKNMVVLIADTAFDTFDFLLQPLAAFLSVADPLLQCLLAFRQQAPFSRLPFGLLLQFRAFLFRCSQFVLRLLRLILM